MSRELASAIDRDLEASDAVKERARDARERGAALDVDWETAWENYCRQDT